MIYSEAVDNLPIEARNAIYFRIWQIVSDEDADPRYERLRADDGPAIVQILRDTKPDLPEFFD